MPQEFVPLPNPVRSCSLCGSTQDYIRRLESVIEDQRAEIARLTHLNNAIIEVDTTVTGNQV